MVDALVKQQGQTIEQCLARASELAALSESPRLDTEVLLAKALEKPRSHLYAWPEKVLSPEQCQQFNYFFERRLQGEPVAYIKGDKEFWSLSLQVNQHTLIPRPATETLVEQALERLPKTLAAPVLDLGTGSGAIALAIACERLRCSLVAVDQSPEALAVARANSRQLGLNNVGFHLSNWFDGVDQPFAMILSNPPYIDSDDPHLTKGDVRFEPRSALVAGNRGMSDLLAIINQAPNYLLAHGWLLLEHGYQQAERVQKALTANGFINVASVKDSEGRLRVSLGQRGQHCG